MVLPVPVGGPLLLSVVVLGKGRAVVPVGPHSRGSLRLRGGLELLLLVILDLGLGPRGLGVRHAAVEGRGRGRDGAGRLGRDSRAASVSVSRSPAAAPRAPAFGAYCQPRPHPGPAVQKQLECLFPISPCSSSGHARLLLQWKNWPSPGLPFPHPALATLKPSRRPRPARWPGEQASHASCGSCLAARACTPTIAAETWDNKSDRALQKRLGSCSMNKKDLHG